MNIFEASIGSKRPNMSSDIVTVTRTRMDKLYMCHMYSAAVDGNFVSQLIL
jgi:hypothetical protein